MEGGLKQAAQALMIENVDYKTDIYKNCKSPLKIIRYPEDGL